MSQPGLEQSERPGHKISNEHPPVRTPLTSVSTRPKKRSRAVAAFFATALTSKGSNLAESSSLSTVRARVTPSAIPGGARIPPDMADPTVSVSLFDDLERYSDSKLLIARRVRTVSGLGKRLTASVVHSTSQGERSNHL